MKQGCMIVLLILVGIQAFSQNKIVVMLEQIAKYEVYLSYLKKGYDIVNKGLTLIGDIKHGDFSLHQDYFNSLDNVNPKIKSDAKIAAMIALQAEMLSGYQAYYKKFKASGMFTAQEINYLYRVFSTLIDEVGEDVTAVTDIITTGRLQMKDDERMNQIDKLYTGMTSKYEFLHSFGEQVQLQALQRQQELQGVQRLEKLY